MDYTPLYIQIKHYIIDKIANNEYKPGDKIPSEKELCNLFEVSRITVSTALKELAKEGYVYRAKGRGTFVKNSTDEENLSSFIQYSFEDKHENEIKLKVHKTLDTRTITPSRVIANKLQLKEGEKVNEIIRLRMNNDKPLSIEYIYIPVKIIGELKESSITEDSFVHIFMKEKFGVELKRMKVYIKSTTAGIFESDKLDVELGSQLTFLESIITDKNDVISVLSRNIINDDYYNFYIELNI